MFCFIFLLFFVYCLLSRPENVTIKKYDPKAAAAQKRRADDDQFLISAITGEKIPAAQAAEHMKVIDYFRISLLTSIF